MAATVEASHERRCGDRSGKSASRPLLLAPPYAKLFDRRRYRAHAEGLDGALLKVETLLASALGALAFALFDPVTISEDGVLMQAVPSSIDHIERSFRKRAEFLGR